MTWKDATSGVTFAVTSDASLVKTNSRLHITRNGIATSVMIDDDLQWGRLSFVRYREWLLVLNDEYVVAGYNYAAEMSVGENEWAQLPFTVYRSDGNVVAERRVGARARLPANFPIKEQKVKSRNE